jgi:hypothetical protein
MLANRLLPLAPNARGKASPAAASAVAWASADFPRMRRGSKAMVDDRAIDVVVAAQRRNLADRSRARIETADNSESNGEMQSSLVAQRRRRTAMRSLQAPDNALVERLAIGLVFASWEESDLPRRTRGSPPRS